MDPELRLTTLDEIDEIDALMKASTRNLFPMFYDDAQTAASVQTEPARVRAMFVRADWTRRGLGTRILEACEAAARAEGFQTLALMATLPGVPLYERFGFEVLERVDIPMPNGMTIGGARMQKPIQP